VLTVASALSRQAVKFLVSMYGTYSCLWPEFLLLQLVPSYREAELASRYTTAVMYIWSIRYLCYVTGTRI